MGGLAYSHRIKFKINGCTLASTFQAALENGMYRANSHGIAEELWAQPSLARIKAGANAARVWARKEGSSFWRFQVAGAAADDVTFCFGGPRPRRRSLPCCFRGGCWETSPLCGFTRSHGIRVELNGRTLLSTFQDALQNGAYRAEDRTKTFAPRGLPAEETGPTSQSYVLADKIWLRKEGSSSWRFQVPGRATDSVTFCFSGPHFHWPSVDCCFTEGVWETSALGGVTHASDITCTINGYTLLSTFRQAHDNGEYIRYDRETIRSPRTSPVEELRTPAVEFTQPGRVDCCSADGFPYTVEESSSDAGSVRTIIIDCPGVQRSDVAVDVGKVPNGIGVTLKRHAGRGRPALSWTREFRFDPADGIFQFHDECAALSDGELVLYLRAPAATPRVWRFEAAGGQCRAGSEPSSDSTAPSEVESFVLAYSREPGRPTAFVREVAVDGKHEGPWAEYAALSCTTAASEVPI